MGNSLYIGSSVKIFEDFKWTMMQKIEMTVMSLLYFFLGIEVNQNENEDFYFSILAKGPDQTGSRS